MLLLLSLNSLEFFLLVAYAPFIIITIITIANIHGVRHHVPPSFSEYQSQIHSNSYFSQAFNIV